MKRKYRYDPAACAIAAVGLAVLILAIYGSWHSVSTHEGAEHVTVDPRVGQVRVNELMAKYCDGPNLIYDGRREMSVVPNSPECKST